jgi:hypothetical protein
MAAVVLVAGIVIAVAIIVESGRNVVTTTVYTPAPGSRLYEVAFKQTGACGPPPVFAAPWSVTLGPWTVAEPANASLPIVTTSGTAAPYYANYSEIVFSAPSGTYQYRIAMGWSVGNPSGNVTVSGSDTTVSVDGPFVSCTVQTTA